MESILYDIEWRSDWTGTQIFDYKHSIHDREQEEDPEDPPDPRDIQGVRL